MKDMWIWKDHVHGEEKGVMMFRSIVAYAKLRDNRKDWDWSELKRDYCFLLNENQEVANPKYAPFYADYWEQYLPDFDLWFYGTEAAHQFVRAKVKDPPASLKMPAVCYWIDQDFWTPRPTQKTYALCASMYTINQNKRPQQILDDFALFRHDRPWAKMILAYHAIEDQGVWKDCLHWAKEAGEGAVTFLHQPSPEQLRDMYRQSRLLWVNSESESGPRVIGEALSCGTPVIIPEETWAESIDHLMAGCHFFEGYPGHLDELLLAADEQKPEDLRSLVNTKGYIQAIDQTLAKINEGRWTIGKLKIPHWIGNA